MIWLCLKFIVDVGLLGLFNVGKLMFLVVILNVCFKIVDYLFMMFYLNFGVVGVDNVEFVVVDISGFIEGVFEGRGFGDFFLGYVECCVVLLYLVDGILSDLIGDYKIIIGELEVYGGVLVEKFCIIVLNKIDIMDVEECEFLKEEFEVVVGGFVMFMFGVS